MISAFDDCLMHLHLGNVYQTLGQHEINISTSLVFSIDEYFRADPQFQAGMSMGNEALVDPTPAMDMHGITMNVAVLHHDAATTQKPHTTCVDVLLFLTENMSECCCFFMSKGPTGTHYNPVVILKCPGIS